MVLAGKVVAALPLQGTEKDEIFEMVSRIKRADERVRSQHQPAAASAPVVKEEDAKLADEWQLPREMFEYFVIDRT